MKIIVLMKQVANKDAVLRIRSDEKWIDESGVSQQTNESDGYALEEALRLKEAKGEGEVVVCTLGKATAKTVIKDALAKGADSGIFISDEGINNKTPQKIAKVISDRIKGENFDVILSGLQSNDSGFAQVGLLIFSMSMGQLISVVFLLFGIFLWQSKKNV